MPLAPGTRLGQYDVTASLGAGGMGEVYRARDTRLGRDVALKRLPDTFTHDPERVARFQREAQILGALNHPHIAAIHGLEEADGHHFLVLELVEGETLAQRIQRGPLPLDEALALAREISLALEAAHERGIVHRDLKPANIALTPADAVKVLDFGLARADGERSGPQQSDFNSPTITSPLALTGQGVILGTAAYMSPEQARGLVADRRSDIWAFGCVLYEMLTGRRPFGGDDTTETLASIVKGDPDWSALPPSVPQPVRVVLEGCLEKDRRKRIADISVARFVIERAAALGGPARHPGQASRPPWPVVWALLAAAAALGALVVWLGAGGTPPDPTITRFAIALPAGQQLTSSRRSLAISPDGQQIVYAAGGQLYVRSLAEFEARPLAGTDGAVHPAVSPDGQSILFWAEGALRRMSLVGGVSVSMAESAPAPFSVSWSEQGILFVEPSKGITRLPPAGGGPSILVPFRETDGLTQGAQLLPDGDGLLFAITGGVDARGPSNFWDSGRVVVQSLASGDRKVLIEGGSNPAYLPTGHILFALEGTLMAVPYDIAKREVVGNAVPVLPGVRRTAPAAGGEAQFAISASGTLAYVPGPARAGAEAIYIYGADGSADALKLPVGTYFHPRVSPDGAWLAFETHDGKTASIAVYNLSGRTAARRVTFGGNSRFPVWTRDSSRIVFQSDREGDLGLFWQPIEGGPAERLTKPEPGTAHVPESWSREADVLLFSVTRGTSHESWMLPWPDRKPSPFGGITSSAFPPNATFSPDGRWVAYQGGDPGSGEAMTYVQPFPATGAIYEIARGGRPMWAPDGTRLFFVPGPGQFKTVTVTTQGSFSFTAPELLHRPFGLAPPSNPRTYDILRDGRIVGINSPPDPAGQASEIRVVRNWFEELKARVPVPR